MDEQMGDWAFLTQPWDLLSPLPAFDAYESHAYLDPSGLAELPNSEGLSEAWNNGVLVPGPSESYFIDPRELSSGEVGNFTIQAAPGLGETGLGSVDGPQVAIEAL